MNKSTTLVLIGLILFLVASRTALSEMPSTVPVNQVMLKIKLGMPVEYDNVVIKGNLTSEWLRLPARAIARLPVEEKMPPSDETKLANNSIVIRNCIIDGRVDFNNTLFQRQVSFVNTIFLERIPIN